MILKKILVHVLPAFLALALCLLTLSGTFRTKPMVIEKVFERPFIPDLGVWTEPQNLSEYLNADQASLDVLLTSARLETELMQAKVLTDVVDSRLALNNLRNLREDTSTRIRDAGSLNQAAAPGYVLVAQNSGDSAKLSAIQGKLNSLLQPAAATVGLIQPQVDFRGVWTEPDQVLLHWTPHGEWIPADGYRLYRTVGDKSELLVEKLGTASDLADRLKKTAEYAEYAASLFEEATLTETKMALIGIKNLQEFASLAYKSGTANSQRARIAGSLDFAWTRDRLLTVAGSLARKLPAADVNQRSALQSAQLPASDYSLSGIRLGNQAALAIKPLQVMSGYAHLAKLSDGDKKVAAVSEILEARKSILAKAFTDAGFAQDAGLGYEDDLKSLRLAKGSAVKYRLETSGGKSWPLTITTGTIQEMAKPSGLEGYGIDRIVSLRWQAASEAFDKSVIAGYFIERKKAGEKAFAPLNKVPVAISYELDETGTYFESPVFYQDETLDNGDQATYRIRALDIFGRKSAWSDEVMITVYKVSPPGAPFVDQPALSAESARRSEAYIQKLASLNEKISGIIVPISKTTADTRVLVVYRAKALGTGLFDLPAEIGRVELENLDMAAGEEKTVKSGQLRLILSPKAANRVDLAFFDGAVEPGYSYKYWAAAVDGWGNESCWSSARVQGVPLHDLPKAPVNLKVSLLRNSLPDLSLKPAGFGSTILESRTLELELANGAKTGLNLPSILSESIKTARQNKVRIGVALTDLNLAEPAALPGLVSAVYGNLPDPDRIQALVALENSDLLPDKSARVSWTPYSGEGLLGYHVYRAQADGQTMAALQDLDQEEIVQKFGWQLVQSALKTNQFVDKTVPFKEGRIYLYLVCLAPEKAFGSLGAAGLGLIDASEHFAAGGWVQLAWEAPDDPQVDFYRVYRCEVDKFTDSQDPAKLEWVLVADQIQYAQYTEKVDQTYARYYYYRVASVSLWSRESAESAIAKFRVPATSPPQTPAMLLPLSQKGKIQVNWAGVPHASQYRVYRTTLPKIKEEDILGLQVNQKDLYQSLFTKLSADDTFLSAKLQIAGVRSIQPAAATPVLSVDKFNTLRLVAPSSLNASIRQVNAAEKLAAFQNIAKKYGPLALAPYGQLSEAAARLVLWEKVGEVAVTDGQDPTGAYSFTDAAVVFGSTYLYTVQAKNDDDLYSGKPMPESASPRKSQAFEPVSGLKGSVTEGKPQLTWNQAKEANLGWAESREYVAGYIVYRSTAQAGAYYQASPLLDAMSWRDEAADPYAYNWYRVKVVDTAGYLSEFTDPVLVRAEPPFLIRNAIIPEFSRSSSGQALPVISIAPIIPIRPIVVIDSYDQLMIGDFQLTRVNLTRSSGPMSGTGYLSIGAEELIEVNLSDVALGGSSSLAVFQPTRIIRGTATLKTATYLKTKGVTFSQLTITASTGQALAGGYLQSPANGSGGVQQNLMGDLFALQFTNSPITPTGVISVASIPGFRYGRLVFAPSQNGLVTLNQVGRQTSLVLLNAGTAMYHPGLETLDNQGLNYHYGQLAFDTAGRLGGALNLTGVQTLRLVIPAGLGIRAAASQLAWKDGAVDAAASTLEGKLILPFQTFDDKYVPPKAPARVLDHSGLTAVTGFDRFLPEGILAPAAMENPAKILSSLSSQEQLELDESMSYLASRIQGTSLLVLPGSPQLQEKLSTVPFKLAQWSGEGFVVPETVMTPANVGNCAEDTSDAIGVTPGRVAVDLDRQAFVQTTAPAETQSPFWLGIIVKEGHVALPSEYILTNDNKRVLFQLTPGELLYDLNGIAYQNLTYSASGIPVNFGTALGGFSDVKVFSCMIDLYGNKVNVEISGEMGIPMFRGQKVKVRLFTSKELGKLVCTVEKTGKFDPSGTGEVQFQIQSGYLQPDGLHLNGALDVNFPDKLQIADLMFTEMIVPSDMKGLTETGNPEGHYGQALFDQPLLVRFHDFDMELRSLSFLAVPKSDHQYHSALTLWGSLRLADNLAMSAGTSTDRLVITDVVHVPGISYEESKARLNFEFEQFIQVDGVVTPKVSSGDDSIVEFETDGFNMLFNSACELLGYPVQANVRMGYDRQMSRYFFALGSYYDDPDGGISFYYGKLNQIVGILGYNLDLPREENGWYTIPKGSGALFNAIDSLAVNRTEGGNYFFASTCNLYFAIGYNDISIPICDVRDCYILVEKGPKVESGGDFYAPLDIEKLITGQGFIKAGYTRIGYYHPERRFQFSSVLYDIPAYTFEVSGEVGFEMNPVFWEFRAGYPDALKATANYIFEAGFGIVFRDSDVPDDSYIMAKVYFNYDTGDISISPVYVRAYLYVGAEGRYDFDQKLLRLSAWLNGGVEGGIKAFGKRYSIIHLMLNANGEIIGSGNNWQLSASARIYYSLDLWLDEIEGSVSWNISKTL